MSELRCLKCGQILYVEGELAIHTDRNTECRIIGKVIDVTFEFQAEVDRLKGRLASVEGITELELETYFCDMVDFATNETDKAQMKAESKWIATAIKKLIQSKVEEK